MIILFILLPVILALFVLVLRFTLLAPPRAPLPDAHQQALTHIDQLEYELGVGPGGQRKLDEEMAAIEQSARRLSLGSTDIRDWATARGVDLAAQEMSALAQTNPEEYWRRVAWDVWRQAGHPPAPPRV